MDTFAFPNNVNFGAGAIASLNDCLSNLKVEKPLIVTDQGLVDCGLLDEIIRKANLSASVSIFSDVDPNPTEANVQAGIEVYHAQGCDGIIGIGGGSAIDGAKGIRLKAHHEGPLNDYGILNQGWLKMTEPIPPMIAIPTTAGTGSEVARGTMLIEETNGIKIAVVGERLFSSISICDPGLTLGLPPFLTAGTGMDAFTHCVEEYISPKFNPVISGIALEGMRLNHASLLTVYQDGSNLEARANVMASAMMGGMGFAKGLGIVHSISHAVGALFGGHHGTLNALLLPACLEFNRQSCLPRFRQLAQAVSIPVESKTDDECADAFIEHIRQLNTELNIPSTLESFNITTDDDIEKLIPLCEADHCRLTNPRMPTAEDFRELLQMHLGKKSVD